MHELHEQYINLKGVTQLDYCSYLKACTDLPKVPMATAATAGYARYLGALHAYWADFLGRTQPLMPLEQMLGKARGDFEAAWAEGSVKRWQTAKPAGEGDVAA
eukprot:1838540-Prymnesium_polylepis.1